MSVSIQYPGRRLARLALALGGLLLLTGASSAPPGSFSMKEGAYAGRVSLPHWNPNGYILTKEKCTVIISQGSPGHKAVTVSFVARPVEVSNEGMRGGPFFLGNFGENEALVVQTHDDGRVVSVTHTSYDPRGELNYGVSGSGEKFRECMIGV